MNIMEHFKKQAHYYLVVLSALGAGISAYQTKLFFTTRSGYAEFKSVCDIGSSFDCTSIEMSRYAELWSGFPLSGFAMAGFLFILMIALFGRFQVLKDSGRKILVLLTGLALLFSAFYLVLMITQFSKLCLFCLIVDAINVAMFLLALAIPKDTSSHSIDLKTVGGLGLAALALGFVITKSLDPQAQVKQEDINDMVESIMSTPPVTFNLPADAPVVGDPNAKITIVKFSDYQCPACLMGARSIHPLLKRYPHDVKIAFINYPLDAACNPKITRQLHETACEAARVAVCAQKQGKFFEAYEALFDSQPDLKVNHVADLLGKVPGINVNEIKTCMNQPEVVSKIRQDLELGDQVKVQSTPTFFVNGIKIEGGLPTSIWIKVIDQLLKK